MPIIFPPSFGSLAFAPIGAWDLANVGAVEASFSVGSEDTGPKGLAWKTDGTKVYMVGFSADTIFQYPVSTPWEVNTAGAVEASFFVGTEDSFPVQLVWKTDGTKVYMLGDNNTIFQYPVG